MSELIHKLGVDWKLLLAQAVNFFILVFLLKKFLYQPIIELLAKRRKAIEESQANVEHIAKELAAIESRKTAEIEKAKKEADAIVQEAKKLALGRQAEMLKEAEVKVEKMLLEAKRRADEERVKMIDDLRGEVGDLVFLVTEKVLRERLPRDANERFITETLSVLRRR